MELRKAVCGDAAVIARLAVRMWELSTVGELEQDFDGYLRLDKGVVFLAEQDGDAIGFAQCGLRHDYVEGTDSSPVGYLEGIFVSPEYRKRGVARALVDACLEWAREQECSEFASDCELDNDASLAFHLKVGFEEANRIICFSRKL